MKSPLYCMELHGESTQLCMVSTLAMFIFGLKPSGPRASGRTKVGLQLDHCETVKNCDMSGFGGYNMIYIYILHYMCIYNIRDSIGPCCGY